MAGTAGQTPRGVEPSADRDRPRLRIVLLGPLAEVIFNGDIMTFSVKGVRLTTQYITG
jgi:hypothetical protein